MSTETETARAADVAVDAAGNIVMAGHFKGTVDFDPSSSATQSRTSAGDYDLYVTKYTPAGQLLWVRTMGGTGWDESMALAVDPAGNVLLTGYFYGSADFDPGAGTGPFCGGAGFLCAAHAGQCVTQEERCTQTRAAVTSESSDGRRKRCTRTRAPLLLWIGDLVHTLLKRERCSQQRAALSTQGGPPCRRHRRTT